MKWNKELDIELQRLILLNKKHEEIANIFNTTKSSVRNRCYRLGLNIINHRNYFCNNCNKEFSDLVKSERKFCSSSCAGSYNNSNRNHSNETKQKIREKLVGRKVSEEIKEKNRGKNNPGWKGGISIEKRTKKIDGKKKCRYCNEFKVSEKHKLICVDCRMEYYGAYRPACEFKFDINNFKEEFDFTLIEQYGWYSPSNKGNNLNGVSRDHLYSVRDGFVNKVAPEIIAHPANCRLMKHSENNLKNYNSLITIDELKERIEHWNNKYLD